MIARALLTVMLLATTTLAQDERSRADRQMALVDDRNQPDAAFSLTVYSTADPATFDPQQLARQRIAQGSYARHQFQLPGYGVVREVRPIELKTGENTVRFTDVAAGIDPTTVAFRSLTAPDSTAVLEQNYEYDLLSGDKLLEKYVGSNIVVLRRERADQAPVAVEGKLLSCAGNSLILQTQDTKQPIVILPRYTTDPPTIALADSGTGLITKPTLVWKISTQQAGKHNAEVAYQTDGLTWRADYNAVINENETNADVSAWVTLLNESGASYPNAKLKLVAGDVQRLKPTQETWHGGGGAGGNQQMARQKSFDEKLFFEYHLYTLQRTTTLGDNSTKQIELFPPVSEVPVGKIFVYYGMPQDQQYRFTPDPVRDQNLGTRSNKKVDIYLVLTNSEKNGMGMPLPGGRVRVYKRDQTDDSREFIGEDVIQHTPKDEQLLIKLGSAFDLVAERKQTDFSINEGGNLMTESFEIKLRNHKKEPVSIVVKENLFRWMNWEITATSDKYEKQDSRTIHFTVQVPPGGEKTLTYTVKYSW